ncbi:Na+/H+ antiporter NhaC family protein [Tepidibacter hydrothermalis]|uniref:Na+/H+ antiporter NhaC family protein n=1 Tax=Tepidibacter hydrothermalis TaxID=3036126 RepID=A0ABY8EBN8_9FIRM|nr:Na+/H+ antiporter NhaC family protein [Tepidibacter hydrothermalis]WFD10337.1 Na+/H+ antiporter NhaC family protein [Tepidibacter hydrothermalis]
MKNLLVPLILISLSVIMNKPVYIGISISALFVYINSISNKYNYKDLNKSIISSVLSAKRIIIILSLVGMLTSSWMVCGTIPYLIYLGLSVLKKYNFILFSFLIMSCISYILGTAVGSISTIGVVIITIGKAVGLDTSVLAGAIISGAFLGDRSSPISSALNLNIEMTNSNPYKLMRKMNKTLIPAFIVSGILYFILGKYNSISNYSNLDNILINLSNSFNLNILCLIPIAILFILILIRIDITKSLLASLCSSFLISFLIQHSSISTLIKISLLGFNESNSTSNIINGGGFLSMLPVVFTIISATAFTGLLDSTNSLNILINKLISSTTSKYDLLKKCSLLSILLNTLTCNQTVGIIIPCKFMKNIFLDHNLEKEDLARCLSDSGTITVALIPWNINSIVASTLLGVSSINFIPYAFLCYLIPITFILKSRKNNNIDILA